MKISNVHDLPDPIIRAIQGFAREYTASHGKIESISVTTLIGPAYIRMLREQHADEVEEDAADLIWRLLGSAVHSILERAADTFSITEERLYMEVDGVRISGMADLYEMDGTLSDYKVTSIGAVGDGPKPEWVAQLNLLAHLYRLAGFEVKKLQVVAILRDWIARRAGGDGYPEIPVRVMTVEHWNEDVLMEYIADRLEAHRHPVICSAEERWAKPEKWAVMRKGLKRADGLFDSQAAAEAVLKAKIENNVTAFIEHRAGEDGRCMPNANGRAYCPVARFCPIGKKYIGGVS